MNDQGLGHGPPRWGQPYRVRCCGRWAWASQNASAVAERICYGLVAVYFATFLQSTFILTVDAVALPLATFAVGNIVGTVLGGQLADRLPYRLGIFAAAMLASGVAALVLFGMAADLITTVGLAFVYVFFNAIARPSLMASLGDVPEHIRGTVMGLNVTCSSLGWLGAAGLGGWMIASYGFAGFGPLTMGIAVLSAVLALIRRFRAAESSSDAPSADQQEPGRRISGRACN
jgi:DHA1 family inner membrane transport protein